MTAVPIDRTVLRGDTVRRRANVQHIAVDRRHALGARARRAVLFAALRATALAVWAALMAAWFVLYVPVIAGLAALTVLVGTAYGPGGGIAVAALAGVALFAFSCAAPDLFERWVSSRVFRFGRRIRYRWGWADLMAAGGLAQRDAHHTIRVPRLLLVRLGRYADLLTVQLCPGVTVEDLAEKTDAIRSEFRAREARVLPSKHRGWCLLRIITTDTLLDATAPPRSPEDVDLGALHLGRREDGEPWLLRLLGRHLLVAGSTGAGKSNIVAAILTQLAPAIRAGTVRLVGIDPKGGMEFGLYEDLFHLLACESEDELVAALEAGAELVAERAKALRGVTRQHTPTVETPLYVVLVDEIASLTAYIGDRQLKERAKTALGRLLTKGRAPGVSVIGCVQDPRKDVLEVRNLFTTRIGLRLAEKTEVAMVLGDGARENGAVCDRIPMDAPGMGYLVEDGSTVVTKVRAGYVDDNQLRWLAETYPSPTREQVTVLPAQRSKSGAKGKATTGEAS